MDFTAIVRSVAVSLALVVAELMWARFWLDLERQIGIHWSGLVRHQRLVQWIIFSVQFVLLAIAVGLVAKSRIRRAVAIGLCVVGAAVSIGVFELISYWFTYKAPTLGDVKIIDRGSLVLVVTAATLAWCIARGSGALCVLPAVLVACGGAALLRWADYQARWPTVVGDPFPAFAHTALDEVLPVVLAWAVEAKVRRAVPRRTSRLAMSDRVTSEAGSGPVARSGGAVARTLRRTGHRKK